MDKTYLSLLILCAILVQGIADFTGENFEESSLHIRKKRLVDRTPYGSRPMSIHQAAYIVNIQKNGISECAGTILTAIMIITAAHCFDDKSARYNVLSGSAWRHNGTFHTIVKIVKHPLYNQGSLAFDLALMRILPPIKLGLGSNRKIELNTESIRPGTPVTFSGWGCIRTMPVVFPDILRIIEIPLMSRQLCQEFYRHNAVIRPENICALDKSAKVGSCKGDDGGPLALRYNLIGIMSYRKGFLNGQNPEVFTDVSHPEIRHWIISTMQNNSIWFGFSLRG